MPWPHNPTDGFMTLFSENVSRTLGKPAILNCQSPSVLNGVIGCLTPTMTVCMWVGSIQSSINCWSTLKAKVHCPFSWPLVLFLIFSILSFTRYIHHIQLTILENAKPFFFFLANLEKRLNPLKKMQTLWWKGFTWEWNTLNCVFVLGCIGIEQIGNYGQMSSR